MTRRESSRHALVLGASGLIGRHLILKLAAAGAEVTAAVRTAESAAGVRRWLGEHGLTRDITTVLIDFDAPSILAGGPSAFADVTEIHNCAGAYRFGMTAQEARAANVGIVERVLEFAEQLPNAPRVVHISGYRVSGRSSEPVPWTEGFRRALYADLGAYEASKVESDAVFRTMASARGVAWTVVNPATVIGDSATGESDQYVGLADSVKQVWNGAVTALPGNRSTFLPIVTVDYLAAFMTAAATAPEAVDQAYWVLDDQTPSLAELLAHVGRHLGVRVPRLRIPVTVIKRLPQWLTKIDPETMSFLSEDRYPTASAVDFAARHGLSMPDVMVSVERWADYLVAQRFGEKGARSAGVPTN